MSNKVAFFAPSHQTYVCAEITATPPIVVCNRKTRGAWEEFDVEEGEFPGSYAFKANNGKYLQVPEDLNVYAAGERVQSWESFTPEEQEDGTIAWKTAQRTYLRAVDTGELRADAERAGAWECFQVEGWDQGLDSAVTNPLVGRIRREGTRLCDASGPRAYAVCHFMEAFSLFCRDEDTCINQLIEIAKTYPAIRFCDTLGFYDYWRGREVAPLSFIGDDGQHIPETHDYWNKLIRFLKVCQDLGLKVHHSRGDMQMFGGRDRQKAHIEQVCRLIRDNGFQDTIELMEVCNETVFNGVETPEDAQFLAEGIRAELPGTLICHGAPGGTEEPDALRAWADGADVGSVHGMRPGEFEDVLRHIFSVRREGFEEGTCIIQGEPFGPGDDVSGTRHDGDPLGRSDDVEFLCAAGLISTITGQRWCYMSGQGVRWNSPIEVQPGFKEVARAVSSCAQDIFGWNTTRGGSANNPFKSPSGYYGDEGVGHGPARIDGAEWGGKFALLVYGGVAPYEIEACYDLEYEIVHPATLVVETRGYLPAGGRITLDYRIGRLVRSPLRG